MLVSMFQSVTKIENIPTDLSIFNKLIDSQSK
jgi:hypothetical protein